MTRLAAAVACLASSLALPALTCADVKIPIDTPVYLSTKEALIGKKGQVHVGQLVRCEVWRDVIVQGRVVIPAGTAARAKVDTFTTHKIAGIKGKMTLGALETETVDGQSVRLTGGYFKEGKGRVALSASLSALVAWPLIFLPGKPAELPVGTVFDAYTLQTVDVALDTNSAPPVITLSSLETSFSAELLYDVLEQQEKPKVFPFRIHAPAGAPDAFVIDRINGEATEAIPLAIESSEAGDEGKSVVANASIKELTKRFRKGINTIEIAYSEGDQRVGTEVLINIQF
jgi:hypothetical protein